MNEQTAGLFNRHSDTLVQLTKITSQMESNCEKIDEFAEDLNKAKTFGLKMFLVMIGASSAAGAMGSGVSGWLANVIKSILE